MEKEIVYKKMVHYPSDFFDWSDGVEWTEDEYNDSIKSIFNSLDLNKRGCYNFCQTGNSMVFGFSDGENVQIFVCDNYKSLEIPIVDIVKSEEGVQLPATKGKVSVRSRTSDRK